MTDDEKNEILCDAVYGTMKHAYFLAQKEGVSPELWQEILAGARAAMDQVLPEHRGDKETEKPMKAKFFFHPLTKIPPEEHLIVKRSGVWEAYKSNEETRKLFRFADWIVLETGEVLKDRFGRVG